MSAERSRSLQRLAAVARRQRGLFTLRQALECGLTKSYHYRQRQARHWVEVEHHVFRHSATGHLTWQHRTLALVLATGGIAGGRSAAALYGLMGAPRSVEVVVERRQPSNRHRRPSARCLEISLAERTTDMWAPRRNGCAAVLEALRTAHPDLWRARNEWEARVLRVLAKAEAPEPHPNFEVRVDGQRRLLDFAWPESMVALEFDGFVPHTARRVFDDDRERQNLLIDAGWKIFRATATMLRRRPAQSLAPVLRALGSNRVLIGSPVNQTAPV